MMIRFEILTLFPEMFRSPFDQSILHRAIEKGILHVEVRNIRDYAEGRHHVADDYPYGGGAGMVMKPEPIVRAIAAAREGHDGSHVILLSPQGRPFRQSEATRLSLKSRLVLVCGRYEGVDERVRAFVDEEISIGDYILSGGEVAAMVIVDAVVRLVPGVVGASEGIMDDSFSDGLIEYPQYTRPRVYRGMHVPEILLCGDHRKIERWRRAQSLRRTLTRRPDLLCDQDLGEEDRALLKEFFRED